MDPIIDKIEKLKKKHDAVIMSHYYEDEEIQDIADYIGDSLYLAKVGSELDNPVVLLAGVVFMGESVKILSPNKTVLVPDMAAGCSLVSGAPFEDYKRWREAHPDHICVTYVNSSAAVKAISDVVCTSSNAQKIIEAIPKDRPILFGPDRNLGRYVSEQTGREMVLWPGTCEVHVLFSAKKMFKLRQEYPDAIVLAHPECEEVILTMADVVGSTSRLLEEVRVNPKTEFIVATEAGILHQMKKVRPEARLIPAPPEGHCACNNCPYMKLNTLEKICHALESLSPSIEVAESLREHAVVPLQRMLDITEGREVTWPASFQAPSLALSL